MTSHIMTSIIVNMASRAGQGWRSALDQIERLAKLSDRTSIDRFVEIEGIDATRAYNLSKEALIAWTLSETEPMIARDIRMNAQGADICIDGGMGTFCLSDTLDLSELAV